MEVIDTLGNYNYTFRIINHPEDDYNTFHNLLVNFDENSEVYWIKYDNTLDNKDFGNETTMTYEKLTSSVPCDPITTNPSNGSSPGGGDAGVGIGTTPGGGDSGSSGGSGGSGSGSGGGTGGSSGSGTGSGDFPEFEAPDDPCTYVTLNWCIENAPSNIDETFSLRVEDCSCLWSRSSRYYRTANGDLIITNVSSFLPNPCDPPGDIGVLLPQVFEDNCKSLKKIVDDSIQKHALNNLNEVKGGTTEKGWAFRNFPGTNSTASPTVMPQNPKEPHSVDFSNHQGSNYFGYAHCHTDPEDGAIQMFSFKDIVPLLGLYNKFQTVNNAPKDPSLFFIGGTFTTGQYMLKINDINKFLLNLNKAFKEGMEKQLSNQYRKLKDNDELTSSNLEKEFLK